MKGETLLVVALLLVCAALLYLDWRRQGEIELLHVRLDALDARRWDGPAAPPASSRVERILGAPDDRTLADIAKENA